MTAHRFVHVSDIHFGQEKDGQLIVHDDVRNELVRDSKAQRSALGDAAGIIVTGDIAYSGEQPQYAKAGEWLDELCGAVGCRRTSVLVVPGNHDVNTEDISYMCGLAHKRLRTCGIAEIDTELGKLTAGEDGEAFLGKIVAYREFAARYGCDIESPPRPFWQKTLISEHGIEVRALGLSSVQNSDTSDTRGSLVLGSAQFTLQREDNVEYIVLLHHPIDWLRDRVSATQYLCSRARVIMQGHEHLASFEKSTDQAGNERITISAGATNPAKTDAKYNYAYSWLEFSVEVSGDSATLRAAVFPRIWVDSTTSFQADTGRLGGQESTVFEVACPNSTPVVADEREDQAAAPVPPDEKPEAGGAPMTPMDDDRFADLRFYFWRLKWQTRLTVLAQLGILPENLDKPLPQLVERQALMRAQNERRLHPLWDAIMVAIPEAERRPNPYKDDE